MHVAGDLRRRAAGFSSQRFARGTYVSIQCESGPEVAVAAAGNTAKVSIQRNTGVAPGEISKAATGLGSIRVA